MGVATENNGELVNALDLDVVPGVVSASVRNSNQTAINQAASEGRTGLYFPAGRYEINGRLAWSSVNQVKVFGDNAVLAQFAPAGTRTLSFTSCNDVDVEGLTIEGVNVNGGPPVNGDADASSLIYAFDCARIRVSRNRLRGCPSFVVMIYGGRAIMVKDNYLWENETIKNSGGSGDIAIRPLDTAARPTTGPARQIQIQGNQCLSNNHVGIASLYPTEHLQVQGNQVIAQQADGSLADTVALCNRKEGIVIQYHTDAHDPTDPAEKDRYTTIVQGNLVNTTRWAGLYLNNADIGLNSPGGTRGVIQGNVFLNTCLDNGGATIFKQAAISVQQAWQLSITGNHIERVNRQISGADPDNYAMMIHCNQGDINGEVPQITIQGNTMRDIRAFALRIQDAIRDVDVSGNMFLDVEKEALRIAPGAAPCEVRVRGNTFRQENVDVADHYIYATGASADLDFSDNLVEINTNFTGGNANGAFLNTDKLKLTGNTFRTTSTGDTRGVRLQLVTASTRLSEYRIRGNRYEGFTYGIFVASGSDPTRGPVTFDDERFINVANPIWSATEEIIMPGRWVVNGDTAVINVEVYLADVPTGGNWVNGDRVWHTDPAVGEPIGWIRSGGAWVALANL